MSKELALSDWMDDKSELTPAELRDRTLALEACMHQMPDLQIEIKPVHHFCKGLYAREITIPAGSTLVGKIHKHEHINIISKGEISVMTENGIERIKAPATIISKPGIKRVGYAHEETVWTTIHPTDVRDIEELEKIFIAESFEEYERFALEQTKLLEEKV